MSTSQPSADSLPFHAGAVRQRYNVVPQAGQAAGYLKAVKSILAAVDGLTTREWDAFVRGMKMLGISDEVQAEVEAFDPTSKTVKELIPDLKPGGIGARMLLRDAIEIEGGDGSYGDSEKATIEKIAAELGVDAITVRSIEALVAMEQAVHRLRSALFPIQ